MTDHLNDDDLFDMLSDVVGNYPQVCSPGSTRSN